MPDRRQARHADVVRIELPSGIGTNETHRTLVVFQRSFDAIEVELAEPAIGQHEDVHSDRVETPRQRPSRSLPLPYGLVLLVRLTSSAMRARRQEA
jgi:hypothetical protein